MTETRTAIITQARADLQAGRGERAVARLGPLHTGDPGDVELARMLGFALRGVQRLDAAEAVLAAATGDAACAVGHALTRFERGLPAAALFARAQALLPDNPEILRNRAIALAAEGDVAGADALLAGELARRPGWIEGHRALSALRWTAGDAARFAESYAVAVTAEPGHAALWLAWFAAVAQGRDWAAARDILDRAEAALGTTPGLLASRFFVATESGAGDAEALFAATAHIRGDATDLTRIRHLLRNGRFAEAEAVALPAMRTPSATLFWPWLSLIWRLTGDARAEWLDRPDTFIRSVAVDLTPAEYAELAEVLRALHTLARPYAEQSVRGGTQTDRSVMLRHEPILQRTRAAWLDAIRGYVDTLPPHEEGHPLLGTPRAQLLIEGSWSVRLQAQGHNVPHTHPRGWLSTAFYIALPGAMGATPAGHIAFGTPPAGLGIELPPYRTIAPVVGQSAVFPSTLWHSTVPFDDGERLVLALDIRRPAY